MINSVRSRRTAGLTGSCLLLIALAGCGERHSDFDVSTQVGPDPVLPAPARPLLPGLKVAEVIGWSERDTPTVPDGLRITAYARDLAHPRTVYTLPNGDVLAVQSRTPPGKPISRPKDLIRGWIMSFAQGGGDDEKSNLITLLRDTNRDGAVDERHDLLTDLNSPFGVAWYDDTLYVAAADAVLAYPYRLGDTDIARSARVLTPLPGGPINHHWTKDLVLGPDGSFLFVSVGSNSNVAERGLEAEKGRAAIWQVDRQTGASRVYASGLRNPNGLTIHPQTGELWAVVNERDELGPNLVPDYMTSVKEGAFYGWPWSYFGNHVDERVHPPRPDMVEMAIAPDYALGSHVAALGMTFTVNSALPEQFRNGAFVGQHGSWNRSSFNGYKVVYIPFEGGSPAGKARDVVTGFLDGDRARGRPVGVGIDGTGALLVADDAGNTIWRIAAADGSVTPEPVGTDRITVGSAGNGERQGASKGSQAPTATANRPSSESVQPASSKEPSSGSNPSGPRHGDTASPNPAQMNIAPAISSPGPDVGRSPKQSP